MSLSSRLWWGILSSVTAAILLTSGIAYFAAKTYLINDVDKELLKRAQRVAKYPWFPMRYMRSRHKRHVEGFFLRINDGEGKELFTSDSWLSDFPEALHTDDYATDIISTDNRFFRLIQTPVNLDPEWQKRFSGNSEKHDDNKKSNESTKDQRNKDDKHHQHVQVDPDAQVMMAAEYTGLREDLDSLRNLLITVASAVFIVAVFIAHKLRDGLLKPVQSLVAEIDNLHTHDIDARIHLQHQPLEIHQISTTLNGLLERLAENRKRERRTIGDIAHELRTPLAALRSELEFAASAGDIPEERSIFLTEQINALQQRVDSLLLLMRLESNQQELQRQDIGIAELLSDAWSQYPSPNRNLHISGQDDADLYGDRQLLHLVFDNIFSNIQAYADGDGDIEVSIQTEDQHLHIDVSNPVLQIEPGNYNQALSPFWRHDQARNQSEAHHGLGLAIVDRIIALHQAQISLSVKDDQRFHLEMRWPIKTPDNA